MSDIKKTITKGEIVVSRVYKSDFQKEGSLTAELKQTVTTLSEYPSKSVSSNLQDNIFGESDFGYEPNVLSSERTNVAWIVVPETSTVEDVEAQLKKFPAATLYRITDSHPILSDSQAYAISQGLTTKDVFADKQIQRHGVDNPDMGWSKGDIICDGLGRPIYKACFLSTTAKDDVAKADNDPKNYFASESIKNEMAGVAPIMLGQEM